MLMFHCVRIKSDDDDDDDDDDELVSKLVLLFQKPQHYSLITSLAYTKHKKNNKHNENSKKKHRTNNCKDQATQDHTVIIGKF